MSETPALAGSTGGHRAFPGLLVRTGWRNLARNRRRTWLTAAGIGFAILLVVFAMCMQLGQYAIMMDNASSLLTGHIQVQSARYLVRERFEDTIAGAQALRREIAAIPGVLAVAPRVEAFALASSGERSFGAQILGVDVAAEEDTVRFLGMISRGRKMQAPDEAVVGVALARNLGVVIGDELVLLGAGKQGGVAALVVELVGIFDSGIGELDRGMLLVPIATVQDAFNLVDEVHTLAIRTAGPEASATVLGRLRAAIGDRGIRIRHWDEVMPEVRQAIEIDKLGGQIFFYIIEVLVVFSVVNTFIMTVFERTREFGMLLAIGMRPRSIVALVQWEAFFIWVLGAGVAIALASLLVYWLHDVGIYMGEALEEYAGQLYMPTRLYPAFALEAFVTAPLLMLAGTQLAALLPSLRIRRLRPVEALREE